MTEKFSNALFRFWNTHRPNSRMPRVPQEPSLLVPGSASSSRPGRLGPAGGLGERRGTGGGGRLGRVRTDRWQSKGWGGPAWLLTCCWHCSRAEVKVPRCLQQSSSWFRHSSAVCERGQRPRGRDRDELLTFSRTAETKCVEKEAFTEATNVKVHTCHHLGYPSAAVGALRG